RLSAAQPGRPVPPLTSPSSEGRGTRETSAVGGTGSKSTGLAANKKLDPYGDSQEAKNPDFDPKARHLPEVFEGNKEEFEGWMVVIIDYLHTNRYTFRDEGTRMTYVFTRLKCWHMGLPPTCTSTSPCRGGRS
ncbi:hypothetical protein E4U39_007476, partial [Claviceps sp. Clav50 group G5]